VLPKLDDPDPRTRAASVASLAGVDNPEIASRAEAVLNELATSPDTATRIEAARAVAAIREPVAAASVVQLLYDSNRSVVQEAIAAVRTRLERDGPTRCMSRSVSLMGNRRLRKLARGTVVAHGERAISAWCFMNAGDPADRGPPGGADDARRDQLVGCGEPGRRSVVLRPLIRKTSSGPCLLRLLRDPPRPDIAAEQIRRDAFVYLRSLADLFAAIVAQARFDGPYAYRATASRPPPAGPGPADGQRRGEHLQAAQADPPGPRR
jgi:hypothetical protein